MTLSRKPHIFTVDVEDYFQVAALASKIRPDAWEQCECRVEANTHAVMELLAERSVTATFFILGWIADRYPQLVREIAAAGHEIASHGYSHQLVYRQTPEQFREETLRSKQLLEDLVQQPVNGYRAASYSITQKSTWALDTLVEAGFKYDSSIFPVRHDNYGIPSAPQQPHLLRAPNGGTLIEYPLTTFDVFGAQVPIAGGGYFRLFPYWFTRFAYRQIDKHRDYPIIFYIHPWELDPDQPRVPVKGLSKFRHYNNLQRCGDRLRLLLGDFDFTSVERAIDSLGLWQLEDKDALAYVTG